MKHQINLFFRCLGNHPGVPWAFFSVLFPLAALDGASRSDDGKIAVPLLIFLVAIILLMWGTVLTTAWKDRHYHEDRDDEADT